MLCAMEAVPSLSGLSDDSSYATSTGPETPDGGSPLFRPANVQDQVGKDIAQYLNGTRILVSDVSDGESTTASILDTAQPARAIRRVCFIGAGYVGGPTAAVIAFHNPTIRVEVLDRDEQRIRSWQSPHLPIHEPGLDKIVRATRDGCIVRSSTLRQEDDGRRSPNLFFSTDSKQCIAQADMIFLGVNTPTKTFGQGAGRATNMAALDGAVKDIAKFAKERAIIVEKSTVPCGTARRIRTTLRSLRTGVKFEVLSNPEFLSEGCAVDNLLQPDRIIIGSSQTPAGKSAAQSLADLYARWVPRSKILEVNASSSELCKLVANAMLAQRISSINSISAICEETGADIKEISKAVGLDPRIGPKFLKAGLGFGGSCFRKDIASLTYLAESLGLHEVADYWRQVNSMNELQRRRFASKIVQRLDENLMHKKIALLGFAFKKDTGDTRESLAVDVVSQLLEERPAEVAIFDPYCQEQDIKRELGQVAESKSQTGGSSVKIYGDAYEACSRAEVIVIITDCDQFKVGGAFPAACKQSGVFQQSEHSFHLSADEIFELPPPPKCHGDCELCNSMAKRELTSKEPLDWRRIASVANEPRWIFDGRCILDEASMTEFGFRLVSLGSKYGGMV